MCEVPPRGVENRALSPGKTHNLIQGGAKSGPCDSIDAPATSDPALTLLINAWPFLSLADKKAILAIVREASVKKSKS